MNFHIRVIISFLLLIFPAASQTTNRPLTLPENWHHHSYTVNLSIYQTLGSTLFRVKISSSSRYSPDYLRANFNYELTPSDPNSAQIRLSSTQDFAKINEPFQDTLDFSTQNTPFTSLVYYFINRKSI